MTETQAMQDLIRFGVRRTRPRVLVLSAITDKPVGAEQLWHALKNQSQTIGRATVFRTLDLLVATGVIHRSFSAQGATRYQRCSAREPHAHLVCRSCGQSHTLSASAWQTILRATARDLDYVLDTPTLSGVCADCRRDQP